MQPQRLSEGTPAIRHGTRNGYTENKCRCDECKKWNTDRCKDYRERKKQGILLQRPKGSGPEHGTSSAYSHHGCRCSICVEAHNARNRAEYQRNKESHRAKYLRWRATEKGRLHYRLAQQVHRGAGPKTDEDKLYASIVLRDPCSYCGAPAQHLDHIVPKSRGGEGDWHNFTGACASCNSAKKDRSLAEFLVRRRLEKR